MACIITDGCIGCTACAKVCPTSAITGTRDEIHFINPDLCIECEACGRVCPTEAVLTDQNLKIKRVKKSLWLKPTINIDKCVACENCIEVCPTDALSIFDEHLPLTENHAVLSNPKDCISCHWCSRNCQYNAIKMEVQI